MGTHSPKQEALKKVESLPESYGWAQIIYFLKREWALTAPQEVFKRATEILGNEENAVSWLTSGQWSLAWKIPLELCSTSQGEQAVLALLGRIEGGVYT
jgi:hypothetical protein